MALAAACGRDGPPNTTGPGVVASVVVTGAPQTLMLVGDSARLVATALNATGGIVANQQVTWRSSAPTVATVRANGTLVAIGAGHVVISATVTGKEGTVTLEVADGAVIGTGGGTIRAAGGSVTLAIPAGTLQQATLVTVRPVAAGPADPRIVPGTLYEVGPEGVAFPRGAELAVHYDATQVPAGLAVQSLQMYSLSGSAWTVVAYSTVDQAIATVTTALYGGGVFAIRSTPVSEIALSGTVVGGAAYAGQSAQIAVRLVGAFGETLPARPLAWSSSDPATITVDDVGTVTALAPGAATVSVTADGASASTTVTVLARAAADWSRATDWSTFQGNPQHTGFNDVIADPVVFRERWVRTPVSGGGYWKPTTGDGRLFLATAGRFSGERVYAIDAATGTDVWVREFGEIFGLNQTTYHGGTVYVTSGGHSDTYLWALDAADGALRYQSPFESQWEHWQAPVVAGSMLVTAGGYFGGMYGFDRATGTQSFFLAGPQESGWAPAASADGSVVYATGAYAGSGGVVAIRPTDGSVALRLSDDRIPNVATPVLGAENDLLLTTGGRLVSVDLTTPQVRWEQSGGGQAGMPVVGDGVAYVAGFTTVWAYRESGGGLRWTWEVPPGSSNVGALLLTKNLLFVSTAGAIHAVDLDSHLTVWSYPLGGDLALSRDGTLYVVSFDKVAAIRLR